MTEQYLGPDRRKSLTLEEVDVIVTRMLDRVFENIGYDVSTAETRAAIRDDHSFIRNIREGTARARIVAWGAGITTFITAALYMFWITIKAALTAKGMP